jgi:hypothetical protein
MMGDGIVKVSGTMTDGIGFDESAARIAAVRARHETRLLRYPNVVGVSEGPRVRGGRPAGEQCLIVYVARKVPAAELADADVLPTMLDGVPVDVQESGTVEAR